MNNLATFLTIVFCVFALSVNSQEGELPSDYQRNSVTVKFLEFSGDRHFSRAKPFVSAIQFSDKFDKHNLNDFFIRSSFRRDERQPSTDQRAALEELKRNDVARSVIAKWYNRKPDGAMDSELIHARGRFAATDSDFLQAATTRRGDVALQDMGNRLVENSYVLVFDMYGIQSMSEAGSDDLNGWRANVTAHLFRVDFNQEIRNAFYDTWIHDDDSSDEKARKRSAFDDLEFPLVFVATVHETIRSTQTKRLGRKTDDQLMKELVQKAYDDVIFSLEREVDAFKVVTPLYFTRPLRAKIGLKEGLFADSRFYVYEHVYNSRTNKVAPVRRGVIRASSASKIHDNRHEAYGDMGTSVFYQVGGRRLREGYTLVQRNDLGLEITIGGEVGGLSGFYSRLDVRTGRFTGIRALFVYVDVGFDSADNHSLDSSENFMLLRVSGGLAKGMRVGSAIELRPYMGFGLENASNDDFEDDDAIKAIFVKPGVNLALNITHNFQLVGGAGFYAFVTNGYNESESVDRPWDEIFPGRTGLSVLGGIKIGF